MIKILYCRILVHCVDLTLRFSFYRLCATSVNILFVFSLVSLQVSADRLCGLVARVHGYRPRGPGFDSRRYQIS
jgi:hypothetical protein